MDTAIQKAQNIITFVQGSEEDIHAYQMREMALSDYTSGINYAWESGLNKGREEGIHIGIHEEKLKIAHNMKAAGISVNQIVALTGLTLDEIEGL